MCFNLTFKVLSLREIAAIMSATKKNNEISSPSATPNQDLEMTRKTLWSNYKVKIRKVNLSKVIPILSILSLLSLAHIEFTKTLKVSGETSYVSSIDHSIGM